MFHRKSIGVMAASALALVGAGCGESNGRYPVYGKVLHKGEPAVGATVSFFPKSAAGSDGQIPRAEVESDGSFRLDSGDLGPGAPAWPVRGARRVAPGSVCGPIAATRHARSASPPRGRESLC